MAGSAIAANLCNSYQETCADINFEGLRISAKGFSVLVIPSFLSVFKVIKKSFCKYFI